MSCCLIDNESKKSVLINITRKVQFPKLDVKRNSTLQIYEGSLIISSAKWPSTCDSVYVTFNETFTKLDYFQIVRKIRTCMRNE